MKFPNFTFEGGHKQTTTNFFFFFNLESGSQNPTAGEFFSLALERTYLCGYAAMLSLEGLGSFVFVQQASPRREFSARLAVQKKKTFYSPENQHGRRVIKIYCIIS